MPHFAPTPEALPQEFPIFPLTGALLLPHGRLPLNIFEPRYLAMVEDALAAGRMFGMIQPDATHSPGATGPALYRVGCLGRLSSFSETEDGRFLITLSGLVRFAVAAEAPMRRGYRRVRGAFDAYLADLAPPHPPLLDRAALVAAVRSYFAARRIEANWEAIDRLADGALVSTLGMVCPFSTAEKQALLEAPDETARAAILLALLRIEAHAHDPDGAAAPPRAS